MNKSKFFELHRPKPPQPIDIAGLEGARIKTLAASEKANQWTAWYLKKDGSIDLEKHKKRIARLIQICLVNSDGVRIFDESEIDAIGGIDAKEFERIGAKCLEANSFLDEGDAEKNSEGPPESADTTE